MLFIQLFSYKMSRQEAAGPFVLPNLLSHPPPPRHRPQPNPITGLFSNISLPSKRRPLLRYKQAFHVHPFMLQQPYLFINAPGISGQTAGRAHHPVARYDDGNRIVGHRAVPCRTAHPRMLPAVRLGGDTRDCGCAGCHCIRDSLD